MAQRHVRSISVLRMLRETQFNGFMFIAALLVVWECIAQVGLVSPLIVPPLSKILQSFCSLVWSGQIPLQILASMKRAAAGYLLAALVCVPVRILMGVFDRLYDALEVIVEMLRPIPPPVRRFPMMVRVGSAVPSPIRRARKACCGTTCSQCSAVCLQRNPGHAKAPKELCYV
jgi:ABC-type nitrate/sulfonate/bicarbonate transport system permease component